MSVTEKIIFVFPSIHHALEAEALLAKEGLKPELMQLPTGLGLGCGTAVAVKAAGEAKAKIILQQNRVQVISVWGGGSDQGNWQKRRRNR